MNRQLSLPACLMVAAIFAALGGQSHADALRGAGTGLSGFRPRPTPLPIRPIHPIHPIHPIRPIRPIYPIYPWNPFFQPSVVIVPNYYSPPTRWDDPSWDGQTRNVQPPPPRQPPKPPERPKILEWNAAKGKAEVYNLNRWEETAASQQQPPQSQPTSQPAPPAVSAEGTENLNRWDDPLP